MAKPMSGRELVEEYEWLISNGVHPLLAAEQLKRKPSALARMLYRYDRNDLANKLTAEIKWRLGDD